MKTRNPVLMSALGTGLGMASLALTANTNTAKAECYQNARVEIGEDMSCENEDCEVWGGVEDCSFSVEGEMTVHPDGRIEIHEQHGMCSANGANGSCIW